jgi:hypothetical protein
MTHTLKAPPRFRQMATIFALVLALVELGLFVSAWRLGALVDPGASPRAARAFVVFGTLLTVQAMAVVGIGWTIVALSRTEIRWDDQVWLEHPWRQWSGGWQEIARVWWRTGWLAIEVDGQRRRWYVRVPSADVDEVSALRAALPPGVWLEGDALRSYYLRSVVPILLAAIGLGGLLVIAVTAYLRSL